MRPCRRRVRVRATNVPLPHHEDPDAAIANPAWRYAPSPALVIHAQLETIEAEDPDANSGDRQISVSDRLTNRDLLQTRISRARYHYCAASDELNSTKELAKISFQPRRPARHSTSAHTDLVRRSPHVDQKPARVRYLRLTILEGEPGLWECRVY